MESSPSKPSPGISALGFFAGLAAFGGVCYFLSWTFAEHGQMLTGPALTQSIENAAGHGASSHGTTDASDTAVPPAVPMDDPALIDEYVPMEMPHQEPSEAAVSPPNPGPSLVDPTDGSGAPQSIPPVGPSSGPTEVR